MQTFPCLLTVVFPIVPVVRVFICNRPSLALTSMARKTSIVLIFLLLCGNLLLPARSATRFLSALHDRESGRYRQVAPKITTETPGRCAPQAVNRTHRVIQILRNCHPSLEFPSDQDSYLQIYKNSNYIIYSWVGTLMVRKEKFIYLKINPFETQLSSCKELFAIMKFNSQERHTVVHPCDKSVTVFHSPTKYLHCRINIFKQFQQQFSITIGVRALDHDGGSHLNVSYHMDFSGIVSPYGFDGFVGYAAGMKAIAQLGPPYGHGVMLSFPRFHILPSPGCYLDRLLLRVDLKAVWRRCGVLQLLPEVYTHRKTLSFAFRSFDKKGYTGFGLRFSFHTPSEAPQQILTGDRDTSVFNCSLPFYSKFSEHLTWNLDRECAHAEDEEGCAYSRSSCETGFLDVGTKCYKYVKTRTDMTWYDASVLCLKQGLTLASFHKFKEGEMFRNSILKFAPVTFSTFIGLRTSDSLLPSIYREVWQWSSGIMAFYVHIEEQQMFKPMCVSFAALDREKLSTTMCGFYKYMHYIFCETGTPDTLNTSLEISLPGAAVNSAFSLEQRTRLVMCSEGHVTHDFLYCDHQSQCDAEPGVMSCKSYSSNDSIKSSVEVSMYVCDSKTQTIHYTLVCDHQKHCFDSSDESFCIQQACSEKQCLNRQCVSETQWCDGKKHCSDSSDEDCPQFVTGRSNPFSTATSGFNIVLLNDSGKYEYIEQGSKFPYCPTSHFLCANGELCLPVYLRCNGVTDSADREDEVSCASVTCPGVYRCRQSAVCVHADHVCDGVFQCPQQDDELLCQMVCPGNCLCQGLAFVCPRPFPVQDYVDLRYLDASESRLTLDKIIHNYYLVRLALSNCAMFTLVAAELPNLKFLDLSDNLLKNVSMRVFLKLRNLIFLSLSRNPISYMVAPLSTTLLENIQTLDLSQTRLKYFDCAMFRNVRHLKLLNLSHSMLSVISSRGFGSFTQIESLDLRGNVLKDYPVKMLQPLSSLRVVFSDVFKLCCHDILPGEFNAINCHASPDEIASCNDLLRSDIYRMFLWISCCFSLIGNAGSFAAKHYMQKRKPRSSFDVFVAHLNVADFFMGLYLTVIGSADQVYRGIYLWHDEEWKICEYCKTAGFLSLLSNEMSAFVICFVSLDRFIVIRFPLSQLRFRYTSAYVVCTLGWIVGVSLAALPLLPSTSHWEFYSQTGICIPLPVTQQKFGGHYYAFGIFIVLNFFLFVFIAVGQMFIYVSVRVNSMAVRQKNAREATVARRLLTVVMTDFLCWFPIGLLGLLAYKGVSIPGEVNVAMAIFAMPLNSALNPFIYTFNLLMEKHQKASELRLLKTLEARYSGLSMP